MKVVYIAHPVGPFNPVDAVEAQRQVLQNIDKIKRLVRLINTTLPDVVPFVPYMADILAMDDTNFEERERGIKNDLEMFNRKVMDELWLLGDRVSNGMRHEAAKAFSLNIPVKDLTNIGSIEAYLHNMAANNGKEPEKFKFY